MSMNMSGFQRYSGEESIIWGVRAFKDPMHLGLVQAGPLCHLTLSAALIKARVDLRHMFLITSGFSLSEPKGEYPLECCGQKQGHKLLSYSWHNNISSTGSGPLNILAKPPLHFTKCLRFPLWRPMKERLRFQRIYMSIGVLSIRALSPSYTHRAPMESRSYSRALFRPYLETPVKKPPSRSPTRPISREMSVSRATFWSNNKGKYCRQLWKLTVFPH